MKNLFRLVFSLAIVAHACACSASPCRGVLQADGNSVIGVSGVLHKEMHWGPPNFGENPSTDSKFAVWILHVDVPFNVINPFKADRAKEIRVTDVQLELSSTFSNEQIAALVEKHITVEGPLWKATSPGDVTDFNIAVAKATVSDKVVNLSCVVDSQ